MDAANTLEVNICLILAGSCLGFLFHNFKPARIYMGDTGSLALGMTLSALGARLTHGADPYRGFWATLLLLFLPLADTTFVYISRKRAGKPFLLRRADHLAHRLVRSGFSERKTALLIAAAGALGERRTAGLGDFLPVVAVPFDAWAILRLLGHGANPHPLLIGTLIGITMKSISQLIANFRKLVSLLRQFDIRLAPLFWAASLACLASLAEGATMALMVPAIKGLAAGKFRRGPGPALSHARAEELGGLAASLSAAFASLRAAPGHALSRRRREEYFSCFRVPDHPAQQHLHPNRLR